MSRDDFVPVRCTVLKTTDAAVLIGTGTAEVWLPKSQCEGADEIDEGDDEVRVRRWLAEDRGLD
jgi:hypothetical protein